VSREIHEFIDRKAGLRTRVRICQHPRVSTFDPETGVRLHAEPARSDAPVAPRAPRNPYETAIAVIWISAASLAVVLLLTGAALSESTAYSDGTNGAPALAASFGFGSIAITVGLLHLAVRAIRWQARTE
jgi:hypothetical protein